MCLLGGAFRPLLADALTVEKAKAARQGAGRRCLAVGFGRQ